MPHFLIRNTVLSDRRLPLPGKVVVIGRSLDADVPIPHKSVSRRHALLEATNSGFVISDLGSSNGTFVEELRVYPAEKAVLPLGRVFRVGEVRVVFAPDEVIDSSPSTPPPSAGPAKRSDGSISLAPEAKVSPSAPPAKESRSGGRKQRLAVSARSEQRKSRRAVSRIMMVTTTVVLLSLAAFFVYRIVENQTRSDAPLDVPDANAESATDPEEPKPPDRELKVAPIIIDKDR